MKNASDLKIFRVLPLLYTTVLYRHTSSERDINIKVIIQSPIH